MECHCCKFAREYINNKCVKVHKLIYLFRKLIFLYTHSFLFIVYIHIFCLRIVYMLKDGTFVEGCNISWLGVFLGKGPVGDFDIDHLIHTCEQLENEDSDMSYMRTSLHRENHNS